MDGTVDLGRVGVLAGHGNGLQFERRFTARNHDPYAGITWERRRSEIKAADGGKSVFAMEDVEVPSTWSQVATDIAADKYFRKAGVPGRGHEHSVRQMVDRVVRAIVESGLRQGGYFASAEDAKAFAGELAYMLVHQLAAPNSPVWFNVGHHEAYGVVGSAMGLWAWDETVGDVVEREDTYVRPQSSACFIQSVQDDLMDIADFVKREMRLFKLGSGSGANFSNLRGEGESLSNGGRSTGMMSFLEVFDRAAGAIKSGGTTRRAAKMVIVDADHPDIEAFVEWKAREETKVRALVAAGYSPDFNGEAYRTVGGQNANNSVRVTDEFMKAVAEDGEWCTRWRKTGQVARRMKARDLFRKIVKAAWECADPGLQYDTTINDWHTTPANGRITGSNPCSEYMSNDDTACNLASLNLMKFLVTEKDGRGGAVRRFDVDAFRHACRVMTVAQEILVDHASYPTETIARNTHDLRQLGMGYANLGAMLMVMGLPYDSQPARAVAGSITALMTGTGYATSAEVAASKGPFPAWRPNAQAMSRVIRKHRDALATVPADGQHAPIRAAAAMAWETAIHMGDVHGYRNAQSTVLAPTGTIGLLMDCDTTGVEPDFTLVKHKKLAGGGYMKLVNGSVDAALVSLGYGEQARREILAHVQATGAVDGAPGLRQEHLAVFDCANRAGPTGRFIDPMGHVRMLAAVQPFVSGSISKTTNFPRETTVEEIERVYVEAWRMGLKCIAVYRDGCKEAQPLSSDGKDKKEKPKAEAAPQPAPAAAATPVHTVRARLPKRRPGGFTQEITVGGHKVYLRTGEYADGRLGEIFVDLHKEGATLRSVMNLFSICVSLGLQHGVPLKEFVDAFTYTKFDPAGPVVGHPNVKMATSLVDAVFRILGVEYMGPDGLEYAHVKPEDADDEPVAEAAAATPATATPRPAQPPIGKNGNGNGNGTHAPGKNGKPVTKAVAKEGQACSRCGNMTVRSGSCHVCNTCGQTTGCS